MPTALELFTWVITLIYSFICLYFQGCHSSPKFPLWRRVIILGLASPYCPALLHFSTYTAAKVILESIVPIMSLQGKCRNFSTLSGQQPQNRPSHPLWFHHTVLPFCSVLHPWNVVSADQCSLYPSLGSSRVKIRVQVVLSNGSQSCVEDSMTYYMTHTWYWAQLPEHAFCKQQPLLGAIRPSAVSPNSPSARQPLQYCQVISQAVAPLHGPCLKSHVVRHSWDYLITL